MATSDWPCIRGKKATLHPWANYYYCFTLSLFSFCSFCTPARMRRASKWRRRERKARCTGRLCSRQLGQVSFFFFFDSKVLFEFGSRRTKVFVVAKCRPRIVRGEEYTYVIVRRGKIVVSGDASRNWAKLYLCLQWKYISLGERIYWIIESRAMILTPTML